MDGDRKKALLKYIAPELKKVVLIVKLLEKCEAALKARSRETSKIGVEVVKKIVEVHKQISNVCAKYCTKREIAIVDYVNTTFKDSVLKLGQATRNLLVTKNPVSIGMEGAISQFRNTSFHVLKMIRDAPFGSRRSGHDIKLGRRSVKNPPMEEIEKEKNIPIRPSRRPSHKDKFRFSRMSANFQEQALALQQAGFSESALQAITAQQQAGTTESNTNKAPGQIKTAVNSSNSSIVVTAAQVKGRAEPAKATNANPSTSTSLAGSSGNTAKNTSATNQKNQNSQQNPQSSQPSAQKQSTPPAQQPAKNWSPGQVQSGQAATTTSTPTPTGSQKSSTTSQQKPATQNTPSQTSQSQQSPLSLSSGRLSSHNKAQTPAPQTQSQPQSQPQTQPQSQSQPQQQPQKAQQAPATQSPSAQPKQANQQPEQPKQQQPQPQPQKPPQKDEVNDLLVDESEDVDNIDISLDEFAHQQPLNSKEEEEEDQKTNEDQQEEEGMDISMFLGVHSDPGARYGDCNQDSLLCCKTGENGFIVGVFDGHGVNGEIASDVARQAFEEYFETRDIFAVSRSQQEAMIKEVFTLAHTRILETYQELVNVVYNGYQFSLQEMDGLLVYHNEEYGTMLQDFGTTAVIAAVKSNGTEASELIIANAGDSLALIGRTNKQGGLDAIEDLCEIHNGENPKEIDRVGKFGLGTNGQDSYLSPPPDSGFDWAQLAVSRSLGHRYFSEYGVTWEPHISSYKLNSMDKYLVITSDGVTDVLAGDDILKIITHCIVPFNGDLQRVTVKLVSYCISQWPNEADNTTAIILDLKQTPTP